MNGQIHIFDRKQVRRHRDRAAARFASEHHVLFTEAGEMLYDRLRDVKHDFQSILDLGAHDGFLAQKLATLNTASVVATDLSEAFASQSEHNVKIVADEEWLPFAAGSFDLIVSNLSLHWVNDLPGALAQIKTALRPDGLFLATLLGGETLHELRSCLLEAELAVLGGASPRLSPSIDMPSASALLQRAGFSLPVTDSEILTFSYPDIFALMRDLRGMGETAALLNRPASLRRDVLALAQQLYSDRYSLPNGRIAVTFEVVFLHGWT